MKSTPLARFTAWSFATVLASAPMVRAQSSYTLIDIGALTGGNTVVKKINLNGDVCGNSGKMYGVHTRAFVRRASSLIDLGTLPGGDYSSASDINHNTTVVGDSNTSTGIRAFQWTPAGGIQDLGTLPGDKGSRAFGINDSGHVVGYSSGPHGITAFLWSSNNGMTSLGTLPGGSNSEAFDLNNSGSVVGVSTNSSGQKHAFLWTSSSGMQDLGVLGGDTMSEAHRINNQGSIIGSSP